MLSIVYLIQNLIDRFIYSIFKIFNIEQLLGSKLCIDSGDKLHCISFADLIGDLSVLAIFLISIYTLTNKDKVKKGKVLKKRKRRKRNKKKTNG